MAKAKLIKSERKVKVAVCLSAKSVKRLAAACAFLDQNQSELVEQLISAHLAGYRVVCDAAKSAGPAVPISSALEVAGVDPAGAIAA